MAPHRSVVLLLLISALVLTVLRYVDGTHFRGGLIYCGPSPLSSNGEGFNSQGFPMIRCEFRIAWRLSFNEGTVCDASDIAASRTIRGPDGIRFGLHCRTGCSGPVDQLSYQCTSFDAEEDWSQGVRQFDYTAKSIVPKVTFLQSSCCWISSLVTGKNGNIRWGTTVSLTRRVDTGRLNNSPRSSQLPIVRLQQGCDNIIPIHTEDPDGDEVRCRWARGEECGGVCSAFPAELTTVDKKYSLRVSSSIAAGHYAVALVLEDFSSASSQAISTVPLQFLVVITTSNTACDSKPNLVNPSPEGDTCIPIKPGGTYSATIRAELIASYVTLTKFPLASPAGMQRSNIRRGSNGNVKWAEMTVTWTPTRDQAGQNVFCFQSTDSRGKNSEQRCVTLLAGASAPEIIPGTFFPNADSAAAPHFHAILQVDFNQQVLRPTATAYVHIYEQIEGSRDLEILSLDTATSEDVNVREHPINADHYRLEIFITKRLRVGATYAVTLDRGAVVGKQSCTGGGAPFAGLTDRTMWTFTTNDEVGEFPCDRHFTQLLEYGSTQRDDLLLLGNGTSCQSLPIAPVANGFPVWLTNHESISICENGLVLFDLPSTIRYPQTFPADWSTDPTVFAPYWCLADNSYSRTLGRALRSNVWYHEYSNDQTRVPTKGDNQMLSAIDALIAAKYLGGASFLYRSTWALVVTWERLTPSPSIYKYQLHNTFQAIFATDGCRSFALYAYDEDSLHWSVPAIRDPRAEYGHAVMGFTTPGHFYTDSRSTSGSIAQLDNIADPMSKYILQQSCDSGALYVFKLYNESSVKGPSIQCLNWYKQQPPSSSWTTGLPSCPPLLQQAETDPKFRKSTRRTPRVCFLSTVPSALGAEQECCYQATGSGYGALLTGYPDGGNAARSSSLVTEQAMFAAEESMPYSACCEQADLCGHFYEKRPSGTSAGYSATSIATAFAGEFSTLDGQRFGSATPGLYSLTSISQQQPGGQFGFGATVAIESSISPVRARRTARSTKRSLSVPETSITAIAMSSTHSPTVQVEVNASVSLRILVDGKDLTNLETHVLTDDGENITIACLHWGINCHRVSNGQLITTPPAYGIYPRKNYSIIVVNRTSCRVVFISGISVEVKLSLSTGGLSVSLFVPEDFRGDKASSPTITTGLLGNFNGDSKDEFHFHGDESSPARYLPTPLTPHDAFAYFSKQWRVPEEASKIIYPEGKSYSDYESAAETFQFIDLTKANATVSELFENTCKGNPSCELLGLTTGSYEAVSDFNDFFNDQESKQHSVASTYASQLVTFDGTQYTYNRPGQYVLTKAARGPHRFEAEVLIDELPEAYGRTKLTGVMAMSLRLSDVPIIQASVGRDSTLRLHVNHTDITEAIQALLDGTSMEEANRRALNQTRVRYIVASSIASPGQLNDLQLQHAATIVILSSWRYKLLFKSGITVDVTLQASTGSLSLSVRMPATFHGEDVEGLLGNVNGEKSDDLELPTGEVVESTSDAIFTTYGPAWTSSTEDSFVYPDGNSSESYAAASSAFQLVDVSNEVVPLKQLYHKSCQSSITCAALAYTDSSGKGVQEFINTKVLEETRQADLGLVPPVFTGPSRISITSGEEVTGQVQASSPGGSQLSFSVIDPAPIGFEFTSDSGHFRWKLQPNAPVAELNLVAKSADGANSVLTPTVFVCDCSHNGTCDFNQITSKQGSSVKTARCLCPSAYDGEHCESDRDGCAAAFQPCFSGVPCIDRIAPLSGYICGGCPAGFSGSGDFCFDIDECNSANLCTQDCVNTQGSYTCSCHPGYHLARDNISCADRDECSTKQHDCVQSCTNTVGSYTCSCYTGFNLDADGKSCSAKSVCSSSNKCSQSCHISASLSEVCSCRNGYELEPDFAACKDINECHLPSNPCQSECNNTDGSFHCACKTGFVLQSDGTSCQDVDECSTVLFTTCHGGQQCINTLGSFLCQCKTGYTYNTSSSLCEAISCGKPGRPANSQLIGTSWTYPNQVQYSCATGYNLVGDAVLRCGLNAVWSAQPPKCVIRVCPRLRLSSNLHTLSDTTTTVYNTVIKFACTIGYNLTGAASMRCLADGAWSHLMPFCNLVRCPRVNQPHSGRAIAIRLTYGSSVSFSCDYGYKASHTPAISTCQISGLWSIDKFTCTAIPRCIDQSGRIHLAGDSWDQNSCTKCHCDHGNTVCNSPICPVTACPLGYERKPMPGKCCPMCQPPKLHACVQPNGDMYEDGQVWDRDICTYCRCVRGRTICDAVGCVRPQCPSGYKLTRVPSKCCPVCQTFHETCEYKGRTYRNYQRFILGGCNSCSCYNSVVTCKKFVRCPRITSCLPPRRIVRKGCCKYCVNYVGR